MPRRPAPVFLLLCASALAAGCAREEGRGDAPGEATAAGELEWRGVMPCADCEAIDTRLVLERRGGVQQYALVEVYVALDGSMSFEETGEWRMEHAVLSLESEGGGLRRFGLVHGGALQPRDRRGHPLPGREATLLLPVEARQALQEAP